MSVLTTDIIYQTIGKRRKKYNNIAVVNIRQKLGMTQSEFARMLNITTTTVANWEQGRVAIGNSSLFYLMKICQIHNWPIPEFFVSD